MRKDDAKALLNLLGECCDCECPPALQPAPSQAEGPRRARLPLQVRASQPDTTSLPGMPSIKRAPPVDEPFVATLSAFDSPQRPGMRHEPAVSADGVFIDQQSGTPGELSPLARSTPTAVVLDDGTGLTLSAPFRIDHHLRLIAWWGSRPIYSAPSVDVRAYGIPNVHTAGGAESRFEPSGYQELTAAEVPMTFTEIVQHYDGSVEDGESQVVNSAVNVVRWNVRNSVELTLYNPDGTTTLIEPGGTGSLSPALYETEQWNRLTGENGAPHQYIRVRFVFGWVQDVVQGEVRETDSLTGEDYVVVPAGAVGFFGEAIQSEIEGPYTLNTWAALGYTPGDWYVEEGSVWPWGRGNVYWVMSGIRQVSPYAAQVRGLQVPGPPDDTLDERWQSPDGQVRVEGLRTTQHQWLDDSATLHAYGASFQGGTWAAFCGPQDTDPHSSTYGTAPAWVLYEKGGVVTRLSEGESFSVTRAEFESEVLRVPVGTFERFTSAGMLFNTWPPERAYCELKDTSLRAVGCADPWRDSTRKRPEMDAGPEWWYWPGRPRRRPQQMPASVPRHPLGVALFDVLAPQGGGSGGSGGQT